jgi:CRISPR-associated protein Cas2
MAISPYQAVWLVALFDLPTDTPEARKRYTEFRKHLLENGFQMIQYSVYARYCPGEDRAQVYRRRIKLNLPSDGEVRIITLTDIQYGKMQVFHGKNRKAPESAPKQIEMF